jgi:hypothetical protein
VTASEAVSVADLLDDRDAAVQWLRMRARSSFASAPPR